MAETPNDDGRFLSEFYPVDLVLSLQHAEKTLSGHPFLDLEPEPGDDRPSVAVENLHRSKVRKIKRWINAGWMVALKLDHKEHTIISFVKGSDYLDDSQLFWLNAICQEGETYVEKMEAVQALAQFFRKLNDKVSKSKKETMKKKRKLSKKERKLQKRQERVSKSKGSK